MSEDKIVRKLRLQLEAALAKQRDDVAISLLVELIAADPKAPRWPHKLGDVYRKRQRRKEAIDSYAVAADLYFDQGFLARAIAMAKTVIDLDPRRLDVLERIDPNSARKLQSPRGPAISGRPAAHAAVIREDSSPPPAMHYAVVPEDDPLPPPPVPNRAKRRPEAAKPPAIPLRAQAPRDSPLPAKSLLDLAPELIPAPDAEPGEVRFSDAPRAIALSAPPLQRPKLQARDPAGASQQFDASQPNSTKLSSLPLFPLFAEVPEAALQDMVRDAELIELEDGALVIRKGEAADALYGIVEGGVEILIPGQAGQPTLSQGDVFGEASLLAGEKRHADVVVRGRLLALKFPRQLFTRVASAHPRLMEVLLDLLSRRLLANLLLSSPLFQEFDAAGHQELLARFEIRRAARGTVLAELGKMSDGLYLNLTGTLGVEFGDGRPMEHRDAGTLFGQASLLAREPSDVRVRALSNMLVLRLPAQGFQTFAMQYPAMLAHLSSLAASNVAPVGS